MKVAIVGSRRGISRSDVVAYVDSLPPGTIVVSGGASGVDSWAQEAAVQQKRMAPPEVIRPDYSNAVTPKLAPLYRNWEIARACDRMVAFWDGYSSGTAHAVACALSLGKPVEVRVEAEHP